MTWRAAVSLLIVAASAGCDQDRREAERAVRAYNEASIHAYRTRDFAPLQEVATQAEWGRVVVLVDLKTASDLVLESELQALDVTQVTRPGDGLLEVSTKERWRYFDRPLKPGASAGQVFVADMTLAYDFTREKGRWKLRRARTVATEYLEPRGFQLAHAPHGGQPDAGVDAGRGAGR